MAEPRSRADLSGDAAGSGRLPLKLGRLEPGAAPVGLAGLPLRASSRLLMLPCRECVGAPACPGSAAGSWTGRCCLPAETQ